MEERIFTQLFSRYSTYYSPLKRFKKKKVVLIVKHLNTELKSATSVVPFSVTISAAER